MVNNEEKYSKTNMSSLNDSLIEINTKLEKLNRFITENVL